MSAIEAPDWDDRTVLSGLAEALGLPVDAPEGLARAFLLAAELAVRDPLGVALPATHPARTTPAAPLPLEDSDQLFAIEAPGWLTHATRDDEVVRIVNHGTDHAAEANATRAHAVRSPRRRPARCRQPQKVARGTHRTARRTGCARLHHRRGIRHGDAASLTVTWADGRLTTTRLEAPTHRKAHA